MNESVDTEQPPQVCSFAEQAYLGRNTWWRYLISLIAIVAGWLVIGVATVVLVDQTEAGHAMTGVIADPASFRDVPVAIALGAFAIMMWSIIALLVPMVLILPWLHARPFHTYIYRDRFKWSHFRASLEATAVVVGSLLIVSVLFGIGDIRFQFETSWFLFLAAALVLVPLQIFAEEVLVRGYLLQLVSRITGVYILRLLLPAIIFASLHLANPEVTAGGLWAIGAYLLVSVYLGFLVLWGDGLEYALGLHLGNNMFAAVVLSSPDSTFGTPTIFYDIAPQWDVSTLILTAIMLGLHFTILNMWRRLPSRRPDPSGPLQGSDNDPKTDRKV